jgi:hypothetical protein
MNDILCAEDQTAGCAWESSASKQEIVLDMWGDNSTIRFRPVSACCSKSNTSWQNNNFQKAEVRFFSDYYNLILVLL